MLYTGGRSEAMIRETIDVHELGEHADEIVRAVRESGEEVTITVDGRPAVALRRVEGEDSDNAREAWRALLEVAEKVRRETPPGAESATDALIRMREEREKSLSGQRPGE